MKSNQHSISVAPTFKSGVKPRRYKALAKICRVFSNYAITLLFAATTLMACREHTSQPSLANSPINYADTGIHKNSDKPLPLDHIVVKYMAPGILTDSDVSCNDFMFSDSRESKPNYLHKKVFDRSSKEFHNIDSLYSFFKPELSIDRIDVRVHIENCDSNNKIISTICMDKFGHFYSANEGKYMLNVALKKYILEKVANDF